MADHDAGGSGAADCIPIQAGGTSFSCLLVEFPEIDLHSLITFLPSAISPVFLFCTLDENVIALLSRLRQR
jgi:hypothetical protein